MLDLGLNSFQCSHPLHYSLGSSYPSLSWSFSLCPWRTFWFTLLLEFWSELTAWFLEWISSNPGCCLPASSRVLFWVIFWHLIWFLVQFASYFVFYPGFVHLSWCPSSLEFFPLNPTQPLNSFNSKYSFHVTLTFSILLERNMV